MRDSPGRNNLLQPVFRTWSWRRKFPPSCRRRYEFSMTNMTNNVSNNSELPSFYQTLVKFSAIFFTQWKPIAFTGRIQERSVRVAVEFLEAAPSSTWKGNVRSMYISTVSRPTSTN